MDVRSLLSVALVTTLTGAAGRLVTDLLAGNPLVATAEASFWDPLTAAVVLDTGLVTTEAVTR